MDDGALDQRLRSELNAAAAEIDPGDASAGLTSARRLATRRRRRKIAGAVLSCVLLFSAGAITLRALNTEGSGRLQTAEAPSTTAEADVEDPAEDATSGGATEIEESPPTSDEPTDAVAATAGRESVTGRVASGEPITVEGPSEAVGDQHWLLPWRDGFLSIRIDHGQQASPGHGTIPDELLELFPPEVLDLFPDGLPPTLAEAQQVLTEAGLVDVVGDLIDENDDLRDAIYSGETPPPEVTADFTLDGVAWESLEVDFPWDDLSVQQIVSTGDRIVVFGSTFVSPTSPSHLVATTTDSLREWSVETLDDTSDNDLPGFITPATGASFAANAEGWMVAASTEFEVDVNSLLALAGIDTTEEWGYSIDYAPEGMVVHPPIVISYADVGLSPDEAQSMDPDEILELAGIELDGISSWSAGSDDTEMIVQIDWGDNANPDAVTVAWEDVDLDPAHVDALREGGEPMVEYWSATWDGTTTRTTSDGPTWHDIHAFGSGFLRQGAQLEYSTDGASWAPVDGLPDDHWLTGTMPVENGTVAVMSGRVGTRTFLSSSDGERWQEVTVDGLPSEFNPLDWPLDSATEVIESYPPQEWTSRAVADKDGLQLTTITGSDGFESYTIVDATSGATVSREELTAEDYLAGERLQHRRENENGWIYLDPVGGGEILVVEWADLVYEDTPGPGMTEDLPIGTLWLLSTADGLSWLVEEIGTSVEGEGYMSRAARNGDDILFVGPDGWERYELDS